MAIPEVLLNHNWDGYVCVKATALADLLADLPGYSYTSFPAELRERIEGLFDERGDAILARGTGRDVRGPDPSPASSWAFVTGLTLMGGTPLIPFDLGLPDGTDENGTYHGPWNLLARAPGPWSCSRHGPVQDGGCPRCKAEADEHAQSCGPSMSCPWWRKTLGWEDM